MTNKINKVPPWVFGFKKDANRYDLYQDIAFIILGNFEGIPRRENTSLTEDGLGIIPSLYSYIGRSDSLYCNGIFFFEVDAVGWEPNERGICPFDTGGIWHGHIETSPLLTTETEKINFFEEYDKPLNNSGHPPFFKTPSEQDSFENNLFYESEAV